ncbi:similar to Saccharomyces cerevisiae YOR086C TCB1 Lipid-binding protein containing three calcium and lipid binding domains [Maudiozyma saulgeensis]|uniref:Similar to Saccharomyces cerevisiae YOR086C TCB1 Lipid-binding protein containing three calcium and lipid binding domains n=1 Tax=Maudiozyma saulgeensis TaxID=1789683 RepID=A0A1X7QYZ9_9SACH|nr:similar to Saccharomyces cerevisiae YOR086C TCB1 Lipid-binding protein containing three calcium and lipid binding domains [Kazachstania saulgeensis]
MSPNRNTAEQMSIKSNDKTGEKNKKEGDIISKTRQKQSSSNSNNGLKKVSPNKNIAPIQKVIPDASYVGWQQISGWEEKDLLTPEDELLDLNTETILDNVIPDKFYGDWYHFVGIFGLGGFLSFFFGYFKFSLAPVFIVMVSLALYARTNSKKYRQSIRNLIEKEFAVDKIENDYETLEWLNTFLDTYWPIIEPTVSQDVVRQVNKVLSDNPAIPSIIKDLWIDSFSLGVKPPRIERVKTLSNTSPAVAVMDWTVSFTPHDLSDMDIKRLKNYVNQVVIVKAKLLGIKLEVAVSEIAFKVDVRLKFQLMSDFPHIDTVNVQLLTVPDIDFVARLFTNSIFSWEVLAIPGLYTMVQFLAKKYLGPVLLPPFSLQLNIPQLLNKSNLSVGVLEIDVKKAKNLRLPSSVFFSTNLYIQFKIGHKNVARTRVATDFQHPEWNEKLHILLPSFNEPLNVSIVTERKNIKDKVLASFDYDLNKLSHENIQMNLSQKFLNSLKPAGILDFNAKFYPAIEKKILPDGSVEELPDLNTGLAKICIKACRGIDDDITKKVSAYAELYINAKLELTTSKCSNANILEWNAEHELLVRNRHTLRCKIVLKDRKGKEIGSTVQSLNDLIDRQNIEKTWIPLKGTKTEICVSTFWKPVQFDEESSALIYNAPIGTVRVFVNKANFVSKTTAKNPYIRVLVNGITKDRTNDATDIKRCCWNESMYVTVSSPNQKISLECMEVTETGHHKSVGKFDVPIQDMFDKDDSDRYIEKIEDKKRVGKLVKTNITTAELTYYVAFYPTLPVLTMEELNELDILHERKKKLETLKLKSIETGSYTSEEKKTIDTAELEIKDSEDMYSNKMKLDIDELLQYNSGVIAITVLDGEVSQPGLYVQTFFDGSGHSRYTSSRIAIRTIQTGWILDAMISELEWSVTTFRVTKWRNSNKADDCICELAIPTIELIKNCYKNPSILALTGKSTAKLTVRVSWFPTNATKLPLSDLITNSGDMSVTVSGADGLDAGDSSGRSDPYVKLYLNNAEEPFLETKHKKRTRSPVWDETAKIIVNNRVNDHLHIDVLDYESSNKSKILGQAVISLSEVDPDEVTTLDVPLVTSSGNEGGVIHLDFSFSPRYTLNVTKQTIKNNNGEIPGLDFIPGLKVGTSAVNAGVSTLGVISKSFGGGKMTSNKRTKKIEEED